jgi:hypothetical protein
MTTAFSGFDPFRPEPKHIHTVERIIPKMVAAIESAR